MVTTQYQGGQEAAATTTAAAALVEFFFFFFLLVVVVVVVVVVVALLVIPVIVSSSSSASSSSSLPKRGMGVHRSMDQGHSAVGDCQTSMTFVVVGEMEMVVVVVAESVIIINHIKSESGMNIYIWLECIYIYIIDTSVIIRTMCMGCMDIAVVDAIQKEISVR